VFSSANFSFGNFESTEWW